MGKIKKISSIVAAILVLFLFVVPSFADSETTASSAPSLPEGYEDLSFGTPYYVWGGYKDTNSAGEPWVWTSSYIVSGGGTTTPASLPQAGWLQSTFTGYSSSRKHDFCQGFTASILDSNGILDTFKSDYSYAINFCVLYSFVVPSTNQVSLGPSSVAELWLTSNHPTQSVQDVPNFSPVGIYPADSFFDDVTYNFSYENYNSTTTRSRYLCYFSFIFHVPSADDFALPQNLNYCSLVNYFNYPTEYVTEMFIQWQSITGVYDPSGGAIEDLETEAEQIIQGQKEAAQYALDQEKAANEEALQDSLDNADTSDLALNDKFGNGLVDLYNALTYSGTSFSIKLPASGTIPLLNTQLWDETEIPIKDYIDKVPSAVWIVINFILWFCVAFSVIHLVHKIIDWINGQNFKG